MFFFIIISRHFVQFYAFSTWRKSVHFLSHLPRKSCHNGVTNTSHNGSCRHRIPVHNIQGRRMIVYAQITPKLFCYMDKIHLNMYLSIFSEMRDCNYLHYLYRSDCCPHFYYHFHDVSTVIRWGRSTLRHSLNYIRWNFGSNPLLRSPEYIVPQGGMTHWIKEWLKKSRVFTKRAMS